MTLKVIQGSFLAGGPKPATLPPRVAALPPIQAKRAMRPPATIFNGRPPGPPAPAFVARSPGPSAPAFAGRPGAVQRQGGGGAFAVEAGQLGLAAGGGKPLPDAVRGKMEAALGADFSGVRVHVGPQAERIGAIAFTLGSDIYFAPGRYQPETVHGQQLLGHELAHVVQQRAGLVRNPLGSRLAVVQDHALEAEADRLGSKAARSGLPTPAARHTACPRRDVQPRPVRKGTAEQGEGSGRALTTKWPRGAGTTPAVRSPIQPMFGMLSSLFSAKTDPDPVLAPRDDSPVRRNPPRFGVGEIIDLSMKGESAKEGKLLKWAVDKGTLEFEEATRPDRATYEVPDGHREFTLSIKEGNGRDWAGIWNKTYQIVAPADGNVLMVKQRPVHHFQGIPSCGMEVLVYILPPDVSFTNLEFMEGGGTYSANGCLSYLNGLPHPLGAWHRGVSVDPINGTLTYKDTTSRVLDASRAKKTIKDPTWSGPDNQKAGSAYREIAVLYRPFGSTGTGTLFETQRLETIIYKSGRMYHRKNNVTREEDLNTVSDPP